MHPQSIRRRRRLIAIGMAVAISVVGVGIASTYLRGRAQRATATVMTGADMHMMTPAEAMQALSTARQLALAQQAAFGTAGIATVPGEDGGRMRYAPGEIVWLADMAVLLSPGTSMEDCHACTGDVAITYLRPEQGRFAVAGRWTDLVDGNGFGQPPAALSVSRDLASQPVLVAETGFTNQGYTCAVTTLVELSPRGPVAAGTIPTGYSNIGAVDPDTGRTIGGDVPRALDGAIADVERDRGFTVRAEGVADRYARVDGRYVRQGAPSALDCGGGE